LGTSFASAILARDMVADEETSTMTDANTGELMAVQTAGDTYDIEELPEDLYEERRQLVFDSLAENPFHVSHAHRRTRKCRDVDDLDSSLCDGKLLLDNNYMTDAEFRKLTTKCENKKVVNIRRRYDDGFVKSDCLCNGDSSITIKTKKLRSNNVTVGKKGPKKKTTEKDEREVIIVTGDERVHWDCDGEYCYCSGTLLLSREGESCSVRKNDCIDNLLCTPLDPSDKNAKTGICSSPNLLRIKKKSKVIRRYQKKNKTCNVAFGRDACVTGYYCYAEDAFDANGKCIKEAESKKKTSKVKVRKVPDGELCNVSYGNDACDGGYYCATNDVYATTGICMLDRRTIVDYRRVGETCDTGYGDEACEVGLYCLVKETRDGGGTGIVGNAGAVGGTGGVIAGPSGTITYGNYGAAGSDGGMGFNSAGGTGGVIAGPSGTITYGNYGVAAPVARTTGVCARLP